MSECGQKNVCLRISEVREFLWVSNSSSVLGGRGFFQTHQCHGQFSQLLCITGCPVSMVTGEQASWKLWWFLECTRCYRQISLPDISVLEVLETLKFPFGTGSSLESWKRRECFDRNEWAGPWQSVQAISSKKNITSILDFQTALALWPKLKFLEVWVLYLPFLYAFFPSEVLLTSLSHPLVSTCALPAPLTSPLRKRPHVRQFFAKKLCCLSQRHLHCYAFSCKNRRLSTKFLLKTFRHQQDRTSRGRQRGFPSWKKNCALVWFPVMLQLNLWHKGLTNRTPLWFLFLFFLSSSGI